MNTERKPGGRRWLRRVLALVFGCVVLEALSFVLLWVNDGRTPTRVRRQARLRAVLAAEAPSQLIGEAQAPEVVHPYQGFVYNPEADSAVAEFRGFTVSPFGFLDSRQPLVQRRPDNLVIGIFGGSFAAWTFLDAGELLAERLAGDPRADGREIVILNLSIGGYKQPQQLLTLAYLQSIGGEFDVVINLDGFNELVLPIVENLPKGVYLPFPRNWFLRSADVRSGSELRLVARDDAVSRHRHLAARAASLPGIGSSFTVHVIWRAIDRALTRRRGRIERDLLRIDGSESSYATSGPFEPPAGLDQALVELAAVWRDASLQMASIARGQSARYLHFLQPNQYLRNTKIMTPEEREVAIDEASPFARPLRAGYVHLLVAGSELRDAGVEFHDLTRLFERVDEPLYRDSCCHVNARGSALVAEAIASAILAGPLPPQVEYRPTP